MDRQWKVEERRWKVEERQWKGEERQWKGEERQWYPKIEAKVARSSNGTAKYLKRITT